MSGKEYIKLYNQLAMLKDIVKEYPGKTIENIIVQIRARLTEVDNIAIENSKTKVI